MLSLICAFITLWSTVSYAKKQPEFIIVIPSYNNQQWYKQNLDSVTQQKYSHFEIIYVNDCSTDKTGELVEKYKNISPLKNRIKIIHRPVRGGPLASQYTAIQQCPDHKIIVIVDGDDMLKSPTVLQELAKIYSNRNIWLTYGSYIDSLTGELGAYCKAYPSQVIKNNTFRQHSFRASHLKTFYAKLFKKIKLKDLQYRDIFYPAAGDVAYMFPMLEMASQGHFKFIKKPLYIWNNDNPINEHKDRQQEQYYYGTYIAKQPAYRPLRSLFSRSFNT